MEHTATTSTRAARTGNFLPPGVLRTRNQSDDDPSLTFLTAADDKKAKCQVNIIIYLLYEKTRSRTRHLEGAAD